MKKEELNFKLLMCLPERCAQIKEALIGKRLAGAESIMPVEMIVLFCDNGFLGVSGRPTAIYEREYLPEVTFEQALELIEQVEMEDDKPEWELVSFDIFEDGGQIIYSYEKYGVDYYNCWQDHVECEINTGMIFAGWQYEKDEEIDTKRRNITQHDFYRTIGLPNDLKAPAIPIKIWFWRRK
jgi:hypothetical protein